MNGSTFYFWIENIQYCKSFFYYQLIFQPSVLLTIYRRSSSTCLIMYCRFQRKTRYQTEVENRCNTRTTIFKNKYTRADSDTNVKILYNGNIKWRCDGFHQFFHTASSEIKIMKLQNLWPYSRSSTMKFQRIMYYSFSDLLRMYQCFLNTCVEDK